MVVQMVAVFWVVKLCTVLCYMIWGSILPLSSGWHAGGHWSGVWAIISQLHRKVWGHLAIHLEFLTYWLSRSLVPSSPFHGCGHVPPVYLRKRHVLSCASFQCPRVALVTLKTEAVYFFKMPEQTNQTTQCKIPKDDCHSKHILAVQVTNVLGYSYVNSDVLMTLNHSCNS
jgi:hypothetical protein